MAGEWRVDPSGRFEYRWWEDDHFTEYVATGGELAVDTQPVRSAPTTVDVGFGPTRPQNRWTVAFRIILAVPHLVWITLVTIAALFVVVAGWFAALFTGALPDGLFRFLHQVLQYHVRLLAYLFLLRDDYPPFALDAADYPVSATATNAPVNRASLLVRLLLLVPLYFVTQWLTAGLAFVAIVLWVVVLVLGRMPGTPALAVGAILRFEARAYGYLMLVAAAVPVGLFGDRDPRPARPPDEPVELPDAAPTATRLHLTPAARAIVVLCLVVGFAQALVNPDATSFTTSADGAGRAQPSQVARSCSSSCSSTQPDLS